MRRETKDTGRSRLPAWVPVIAAGLIAVVPLAACTSDAEEELPAPGATASVTAPADATATVPSGPAAPVDVVLTGPLPDTNETVTPGEGETGRVTIEWSYAGEVDGFRIYLEDCDGNTAGEPIEVGPGDRMYGPLQPCRPGGKVGVAAFDGTGESEIAWAQPGEAD